MLPADAVVLAGLAVGTRLDRGRAGRLARELRRADALRQAGRALRARDLSRRELDERLERRGVGREARAEAAAALERSGLLDDRRFAHGRADTLARRGYGDEAIRHDLELRGIARETAEAAIAQLEPERERAERLVARGGGGVATARRLAARGFGDEAVEAAAGGSVAGGSGER